MRWFLIDLECSGCEKTTYRPPANTDGCSWCGGLLAPVVRGQLGLFASEAAVTA